VPIKYNSYQPLDAQLVIPMDGKSKRFFNAGDPNKGEHQSWKLFLTMQVENSYRNFFQYGNGEVTFQITVSKNNK
jgi:hypothetical protein